MYHRFYPHLVVSGTENLTPKKHGMWPQPSRGQNAILSTVTEGGAPVSQEPFGLQGLRFSRVDHVAINAGDLDRSAAFYARVFGLIQGPRSSFRLILESPTLTLHLFQAPEPPLAADVRDWRRPGVQHVALALSAAEFERASDVIVAAGSAVEGSTDDPEGRSLYFRDPDGNVVELRSDHEPRDTE